MGAWIETQAKWQSQMMNKSHPVWVRGLKQRSMSENPRHDIVAPCMGAWIETMCQRCFLMWHSSHPVWVRGLKHPRRIVNKNGQCRTLYV